MALTLRTLDREPGYDSQPSSIRLFLMPLIKHILHQTQGLLSLFLCQGVQ